MDTEERETFKAGRIMVACERFSAVVQQSYCGTHEGCAGCANCPEGRASPPAARRLFFAAARKKGRIRRRDAAYEPVYGEDSI